MARRAVARKLPRNFYARSTLTVARELIGLHLVHRRGKIRQTVRIVETRPLSARKRWRVLEIVARTKQAGTLPEGAAARGKVTLRSIVKADSYPGRMETVHAEIPGDGSTDQAVALSGHLYEGYIKQGANDDASGCAVTLEMGRTLLKLVAEGKLPKPKRTIHFLWVPEISGTTAWLNRHPDVTKKLIADLNFDMEGLRLASANSIWVMHRTPDTFPTFLNDVGASFVNFVAELNRERVRYRSNGYGFTLPVATDSRSRGASPGSAAGSALDSARGSLRPGGSSFPRPRGRPGS